MNVIVCYITTKRLDGSVDTDAIFDYVTKGTPLSGKDQEWLAAFAGAPKFTEEFITYWIGRLPRRKWDEFGEDTLTLIRVFQEESKRIVALGSEPPPRPDLG